MIMVYLNLDDFAELGAAASLYSIDLKPYLQNSATLSNTVIYKNHFNKWTAQRDHPIINFDRLWQMSADELLTEVRVLNLTWKPLYKTDIVMPFLVERCSRKPVVSFNPIFDIMALVEKTQFYILSYGGVLRTERGQLIYAEQVGCSQVSFLSWNPTGTYLLACFYPRGELQHFCDRQLVLYKYLPQNACFKKNIITQVSLRGSGTMLTPCLWINNTSFIWCKNPSSPLLKISLTDYDDTVTITTLVDNIKQLFQLKNLTGGFICLDNWSRSTSLARSVAADDFTCQIPISNFGNFFALPCHTSEYFFCVLRCPIHVNLHDCIGVFSREALKLVYIISIPGQMQEIRCNQKTVFGLFSRCKNISELEIVHRVRRADLFAECPYQITAPVPIPATWWENRQTDICCFTDANLEPTFMSRMCCPIAKIFHKNKSLKQRSLFDDLCDSRHMQLTSNFLLITSFKHDRFHLYFSSDIDSVIHQRIFLNHHYIESKKENVAPDTIPKTLFCHPTKGIIFVHEKIGEMYFPYFGLARSANLEHFMYFPEFDPAVETEPPFNYPMISTSPFPVSENAILEDL